MSLDNLGVESYWTLQCVLEFDNQTMHDAPSTKWK